ncbi:MULTISPECIES: DUF6090 family protein [unclassified Lacinutrix]|nr:DUF6090 family protein [Lacinutrix sp. WUR7]QRM89273.1 hypothetical protein FG167_08515 [Lacinutrix sp. WUR7]
MIKFFRKIRYDLMEKNKTGKYFKYAIGEIILVVIGILIALSINNWNEHRKQQKIEQEYLLSLQSEFNNNLDKINSSIKENETIRNGINGLLNLFDNEILDTVSDKYLNEKIFAVLGNQMQFKPSNGVLNDIISSGNLNLILNQKLRQRLASFDSSLEILKLQINFTLAVKENLKSIIYKEGSVRKLASKQLDFQTNSISKNINNKSLFNSVEFENYLIDYALLHKSAAGTNFLGGIKNEIETILIEIEQELNK